jgi:hypothetical protein
MILVRRIGKQQDADSRIVLKHCFDCLHAPAERVGVDDDHIRHAVLHKLDRILGSRSLAYDLDAGLRVQGEDHAITKKRVLVHHADTNAFIHWSPPVPIWSMNMVRQIFTCPSMLWSSITMDHRIINS